nr:cytochrome P450 3049C1 [Brachionus rubens]
MNHFFVYDTSTALASCCLAILSYAVIKQYYKRKKYCHIPGPPTNGILEYFFGNYNSILNCLRNDKIIPDLYVEWAQKYGSVFKFQIFSQFVIVTNEPDAIKEIIINKNFPKNGNIYSKIGFPYEQRFMGLGLVTDTNEQRWKKRRAIFNPGFHRSVLMNCLKEFNLKTDILMEKFRTLADGKTEISLFKEINRMTLDIISSVAFGFCIDTINYPDNEFSHNITKSFEAVNRCLSDPLFMINPFSYWKKKEYKNVIQDLRNFARDKILKRLENLKNNEYAPDDILTAIVSSCKDDEIDLESLVDDFITFFNAGQETTANTLAFCFLELGRNPQVYNKLKEEIDLVMGSKTELDYDDISRLEYTGCVFKETLRLWPPAPEILRVSTEEFYINDLKVPKNTPVNLSPYFSGRNPKYFPNPDHFEPERFTNQEEISNYTYFPFSIGPRNCIGRNFAIVHFNKNTMIHRHMYPIILSIGWVWVNRQIQVLGSGRVWDTKKFWI